MTYILSFIVSFGVAAIVGQLLIPLLRRLKAGQSIRKDGPTWHMSKQGTPTMGGIMFILAIGAACLVAGWEELRSGNYNHLYVFLFALVFGVIGFIDDFQKLRHHANEGLTAAQKFLLQLAAAIAFTVLMREQGYLTPNLYIPFLGIEIVGIPWVAYMVFAAFVMVGTVNAVNLTDGIDGLAAGVTIPVALFYMAVSAWFGKNDLAILSAALTGGLAAFLIYNFHPAKVFMGDTGSLFLGGMVCGLAFALDVPLVIPIIGLVYVAEVLSDIIQVVYFKKTHGKRFFRMAPLHHHLEMGGWSETKLFCIFSGVTLALCCLGFLGVMYRYPM
ncbi:phospho-N-acetylmuramoyl-pentapeptide-transferase [Colidextribacter sp. OB.20]|uniref:phospho-N-acetylmuramoyl-pentapeptide- transferase n=1 Tax=Colidextribacter sp. OB.20 TaxID=2304568 RepID=UPI00136F3E78|nr:phospho-N-acetylmuramoyl-pentapeptide-transferase [Colidextribacter sp. OB.20]NBI08989.1 phospho-N-acetylmuramoyl-pentapeptide-transferase [Colidextribacter sp. OB.20]